MVRHLAHHIYNKERFSMTRDIKEVLLTQEQIQCKVKELAQMLSEEYAGKDPVFVGVLKGVVMFFADVVRNVQIPCQIDFMWLSSYGSGSTSGTMAVKKDVSADLKGRHVVILEDIFDTGNSLSFTVDLLRKRIHKEALPPQEIKVPARLVCRNSCGRTS